MAQDILAELGLVPDDVGALPGNLRSRLIGFLLRWEHYQAALACLDRLVLAKPTLVSLLDARARAQQGLGDLDGALMTMAARHEIKASMTSRAFVARLHLAKGDMTQAQQVGQALMAEEADRATVWGLMGEIHLAQGNLAPAEEAYRRLLTLSPTSRPALLGLMDVYRARGDWVSAAAYAVRAQTVDPDRPLSVDALRVLSQFYRLAGDANRAVGVEATLAQVLEAQTTDLKEALAAEVKPAVSRQPARPPDRRPGQERAMPRESETSRLAAPAPPAADERALLQAAARQHFRFDTFLPGQAEVMAAALRGEDLLAVMPTGGGKSLCYQLPALLDRDGTTLVISPLIALMKDQLDSLPPPARAVTTTINSTMSGDELRQRMTDIARGRFRLVFAAPERLRQLSFLHVLRRAKLARLVIDEAHCVSLWGHDFRPDYFFIAEARRILGNPPLLAMTATAPERVRRDIVRRLGDLKVVAADIFRPNLCLEVILTQNQDEKLGRLVAICQHETGSGIIYAGTRARCESLAAMLRSQGVDACHYHAGIVDRAGVQDAFMTGQVRVVVATVAFGLGIDKPDIRFVVHFAPPPSLEAYYQEAGRAGRDGLKARCILFFGSADKSLLARRATGATLPVEFLRQVYAAVQQRLAGLSLGRVAADDLCRDVQADETPVRVALSLLETAGLLRRHLDAPRSALITVRRGACQEGVDADLERFSQAARLIPGQSLEIDPVVVARQAGLDPVSIEQHLLEWSDRGWVRYRPASRDLLLERLSAPPDSAERVANLLEQYTTLGRQRVEEVSAYARTDRCRHGYLSAYLGGRLVDQCGACDNCLGLTPGPDPEAPIDEREQWRVILNCVAATRHGIGPVTLVRTLVGSKSTPEWAGRLPGYAALAFRSESAVGRLVDQLVAEGMLQTRGLDHGGTVLELIPAGKRATGR